MTSPTPRTRFLADVGDHSTPPVAEPSVRLAAPFDTYLLGYRGRELAVPAAHAHRINAGGGMIRPTVLVDGLAVATWRVERSRGAVKTTVEPFDLIADATRSGIEAESRDVARFLDG